MPTEPDNRPLRGPRTEQGVFTRTHWSLVLAAGQGDSLQAQQALEKLCRSYWYPLYAYLRRRGYTEHDAQDLTQSFFAHLLRHEAIRAAVPSRGRFRSFLLASFNHFLADEQDRAQAQKRGGGEPLLSLDAQEAEQRYQLEPRDPETPEKVFERRWAISLLDRALARLEKEFVTTGKGRLFEALRAFLVERGEGRPYAEVACALGMTEEAVKKAVQRLRRRYQEIIREEIAQGFLKGGAPLTTDAPDRICRSYLLGQARATDADDLEAGDNFLT